MVNGHPLTSKGPLMDTLSVVLVPDTTNGTGTFTNQLGWCQGGQWGGSFFDRHGVVWDLEIRNIVRASMVTDLLLG